MPDGGFDADAPVFESGGFARFDGRNGPGITLSFAEPLPAEGIDPREASSLRISVHIVMTPLAVAQMAKFLAHHFPLADPIPEPGSKH